MKVSSQPHDDLCLFWSLGQVGEGRSNPVIHAIRGEELIAEDAEEPRFAEELMCFVLGKPRLLCVLGDKLFGTNCVYDRTKTAHGNVSRAPRKKPTGFCAGQRLP
jgi:hypothetical protein